MPRSRLPELVVFSDLDGTLLDHETYGFEAARPALEALRARRIPLVLASSKTAAEIAPLRARLGFSGCPAIVENGAGVLPGGAMPSGGGEVYARLRHALETVPASIVEQTDWPGEEWRRLAGDLRPDRSPAIRDRLLALLVAPTRFFLVRDGDGAPVANAYAGVYRDHWTIHNVATRPDRRRAGHGRAAVAAAIRFGLDEGAQTFWIAVVSENTPAVRLYESFGLAERFRYHYRREGAAAP